MKLYGLMECIRSCLKLEQVRMDFLMLNWQVVVYQPGKQKVTRIYKDFPWEQ